jgi:hypothetical protein
MLANEIHAEFTNNPAKIRTDADVYIFSVKDDALPEILHRMPKTNGTWIHTAGSVPMHIF